MLKGKERRMLIKARCAQLMQRTATLFYLKRQGARAFNPASLEDSEQKTKVYEKVIEDENLLTDKQGD